MPRPKKKTASESVMAYIKKAYDRIEVKVPKPDGERFKMVCAKHGTNPNRLLNEWIHRYLEQHTSEEGPGRTPE